MFWLEALHGFADRSEIFLIEKMRAVTATTLLQFGCIVIQHTLTALAVNAHVVGTHVCRINHPSLIGVAIGKTDVFVEVIWSRHEHRR
jgi:hypothetical protein